ncbi:MAG: HIT domain-containing protein [Christensenellales bacterium]|jgi:histidine triad (HIT) family protein
MENCIFCKIIDGSIPSEKLYEDEDMIVIKDINPQAPVHLLMIVKTHYANVLDMNDKQAVTLGKCIKKFADFASESGISSFRLITNAGEDARQSVSHLHVHLLGGKKLNDKMG